jgi:RNA polymerase sigma-70 factor, ECF subfamily
MSIATVPGLIGEVLTHEFEQIFREYSQFVYRTAYSVTGNHPDAEDVVQTIFLKLLQREVPAYLRKEPKAYLYRAAVNAALNIVRSKKRQHLTDLVEVAASPSGAEEEEAIQQNLLDSIAQLTPQAVEILVLRYAHDYSDAQIARLLGKSR